MKQFLIQLLSRPWRVGVQWYLRKPRSYRYRDISVMVWPEVFHPGFFFSTRFLLGFLERQDLRGKTFLELGCGSGLIAVTAARRGARVTASDINTTAVRSVVMNAARNEVVMKAIQSDLFQHIPPLPFDWIVINPPYYPADPADEAACAWYCGKDHEYFSHLFASLGTYIHSDSRVLMVLSDVCNLSLIFSIAREAGFLFELVETRRVWTDGRNYLYWIKPLL